MGNNYQTENILDFLSDEFNNNRLCSARIEANSDGKSLVHLTYINPVTEFEYVNSVKNPSFSEEREVDYQEASNSIRYLIEKSEEIKSANRGIIIAGTTITNHVIIHKINQGFYESAFYFDYSEKDMTNQEKAEYFVYYLNNFMKHIVEILHNNPKEKKYQSISKVSFSRSHYLGTDSYTDSVDIYANNILFMNTEFNSFEVVTPYKLGSFNSGLFFGLNIELNISWEPEGQYDTFIVFSDKENPNGISLFGEQKIETQMTHSSIQLITKNDSERSYCYYVSGKILDLVK